MAKFNGLLRAKDIYKNLKLKYLYNQLINTYWNIAFKNDDVLYNITFENLKNTNESFITNYWSLVLKSGKIQNFRQQNIRDLQPIAQNLKCGNKKIITQDVTNLINLLNSYVKTTFDKRRLKGIMFI